MVYSQQEQKYNHIREVAEQEFYYKYPSLAKIPFLGTKVFNLLCRILAIKRLAKVLVSSEGNDAFRFVQNFLDVLNITYFVQNTQMESIPESGRVLIIANHPFGSQDGLALIDLVGKTRQDVKILISRAIYNVNVKLQKVSIPFDSINKKANAISAVREAVKFLENEGAIILFPAGEVSRWTLSGIRDRKWSDGFLYLVHKTQAPIVPIYIKGRQTLFFYIFSFFFPPLAFLLITRLISYSGHRTLYFNIGDTIPYSSLRPFQNLNLKELTALLQKHLNGLRRNKLYAIFKTIKAKALKSKIRIKPQKGKSIGKNKNFLFRKKSPVPAIATVKSVKYSENKSEIYRELRESKLVRGKSGGYKIYIFRYFPDSFVIRELGRLRELAFRKVGEGTGNRMDTDNYDTYYDHIIVWDEKDLEIVGSYRAAPLWKIMREKGIDGIYTSSLFDYKEEFIKDFDICLEVGRSFIQPRYWKSITALDSLWHGLAAYTLDDPRYEYYTGVVSLSDIYPEPAKQLIIAFCDFYFYEKGLAVPKRPYEITSETKSAIQEICQNDCLKSMKHLSQNLMKKYNLRLPPLFKQYIEATQGKGTSFLGFHVDSKFNNCIDALIRLRIGKMSPRQLIRYFHLDMKPSAIGEIDSFAQFLRESPIKNSIAS